MVLNIGQVEKNDFLSRDKGLDVDDYMAPFLDRDNDGIYHPSKGDYPVINPKAEAYADQMVSWVLNDYGNNHTATHKDSHWGLK